MDVIRDAIVDLRRAGTTIVFSTHDMDVAEKMCDSIFMLHQGRKVLDGTLEEIQKQFGADTVRVRVASGSTVAFDRLPAVARVNDFGRFQELRMTPGGDPQAILRALTGQATIELFEVAVPGCTTSSCASPASRASPPRRQRMHRIWIIARREYRATVRSKAFVVSLVLMPLLLGGGALAQKAMRGRVRPRGQAARGLGPDRGALARAGARGRGAQQQGHLRHHHRAPGRAAVCGRVHSVAGPR